jgi:hypothetical protein
MVLSYIPAVFLGVGLIFSQGFSALFFGVILKRRAPPSGLRMGLSQKMGARSCGLGEKQFEDEEDDEHEGETLARKRALKIFCDFPGGCGHITVEHER